MAEITIEEANKRHAVQVVADRKRMAKEKIHNLVQSYPKDTSDDWVVFGYGGTRITLGDLKDLFGVEH